MRYYKNKALRFCYSLLLLSAASSLSSFSLANDALVSKLFWSKLYPTGGSTFFCQQEFKRKSARLAIDLIYSSDQIGRHVGCSNKIECKRNDQYMKIAADYHNMQPTLKKVYLKRKDSSLGEIDVGSHSDFEDLNCVFRTAFQTVDPRDEAKGDIARIMFYMKQHHGVPLIGTAEMFKRWNKSDPVDDEERRRNDVIEKLQGNRNPFIDTPSLGDSITQ